MTLFLMLALATPVALWLLVPLVRRRHAARAIRRAEEHLAEHLRLTEWLRDPGSSPAVMRGRGGVLLIPSTISRGGGTGRHRKLTSRAVIG